MRTLAISVQRLETLRVRVSVAVRVRVNVRVKLPKTGLAEKASISAPV